MDNTTLFLLCLVRSGMSYREMSKCIYMSPNSVRYRIEHLVRAGLVWKSAQVQARARRLTQLGQDIVKGYVIIREKGEVKLGKAMQV